MGEKRRKVNLVTLTVSEAVGMIVSLFLLIGNREPANEMMVSVAGFLVYIKIGCITSKQL